MQKLNNNNYVQKPQLRQVYKTHQDKLKFDITQRNILPNEVANHTNHLALILLGHQIHIIHKYNNIELFFKNSY